MHNLSLLILVKNTIFTDLLRIALPELHGKLQLHSLQDFMSKGRKKCKTNYTHCNQCHFLCELLNLKSIDSTCPK